MAIGTPTDLGRNSAGSGTTLAITTAATASAGTLIVVFTGSSADTDAATGVTDSASNSYTGATASTGNTSSRIFYCMNATQLASGGTITVTYGNSQAHYAVAVAVSGVATASALDQETGNNNFSSTGLTLTTGTLSQADEIAFAQMMAKSPGTFTEASGFTTFTSVGGTNKLFPSYKTVAATTAISYAPSLSGAATISEVIATFKGAAAAATATSGTAMMMGI